MYVFSLNFSISGPLQSLWYFGAGRDRRQRCRMCSAHPGQWPTLLDRLLMEIRVDFKQWIKSLPRLVIMKNGFLSGKTEISWMLSSYIIILVSLKHKFAVHTKHGDSQPCFSGQLLSMFILSSLNNKLFHCLSLSGLLSCACFTCGLSLAMLRMEHNEALSGT